MHLPSDNVQLKPRSLTIYYIASRRRRKFKGNQEEATLTHNVHDDVLYLRLAYQIATLFLLRAALSINTNGTSLAPYLACWPNTPYMYLPPKQAASSFHPKSLWVWVCTFVPPPLCSYYYFSPPASPQFHTLLEMTIPVWLCLSVRKYVCLSVCLYVCLSPSVCLSVCLSVCPSVRVKISLRWATGKRRTNRLPKLSLITRSPPGTAGYSGPDRIYWSPCQQLAVPFSGAQGEYLSDSGHKEIHFSFKRVSWWTWDSNSWLAAQVLSTMPYVKALVRCVTGERLTNRLPKLSLITSVCLCGNRYYLQGNGRSPWNLPFF